MSSGYGIQDATKLGWRRGCAGSLSGGSCGERRQSGEEGAPEAACAMPSRADARLDIDVCGSVGADGVRVTPRPRGKKVIDDEKFAGPKQSEDEQCVYEGT